MGLFGKVAGQVLGPQPGCAIVSFGAGRIEIVLRIISILVSLKIPVGTRYGLHQNNAIVPFIYTLLIHCLLVIQFGSLPALVAAAITLSTLESIDEAGTTGGQSRGSAMMPSSGGMMMSSSMIGSGDSENMITIDVAGNTDLRDDTNVATGL